VGLAYGIEDAQVLECHAPRSPDPKDMV
jgi:hypothetical protein